ncbi:MAG: hypothetical protein GWP19_08180 [Planctomycetia bacterium]|nr:hypothetical protein [Planctomycetia bacterium]
MKKLICLIFLGLFTFLNAQGITNTLGTNDNTSWFDVQNSDGTTPLLRIYGDGWTAFGLETPEYPFHVEANRYDDDAGVWLQPTGFFNNTVMERDGVGVFGQCDNTDFFGVGVLGQGGWVGVRGRVISSGNDNKLDYNGVYGYAESVGGFTRGVKGYGDSGYRVYGGYFYGGYATDRSFGVYGQGEESPLNYGGYFTANDAAPTGWNCGVYADATTATAINYGGYFFADGATTNWAGWFQGNVNVTGDLTTSTATYKIDHPLDPQNKYLSHSSVESSDMMNIYNGNTELNYAGEAKIVLPEWLEALNSDFRYQLTAIGAPAPNLYVAQEVSGNTFRVAGGEPGMKVSWQITGIRKDAYAVANRVKVEEYKAAKDIGKYLNPEVFGMPKSKQINNEPTLKNEMLAKENNRRERR